jgi:putative hydrolase of the HAD superfamily
VLRAVLFDLWETLITDSRERALPRRAWRSDAVHSVLQRHGHDASLETVLAALEASGAALARLHDDGKDLGDGGRARLFIAAVNEQTGVAPPEAAVRDLEDVITAMPLEIAPVLAPYAVEALAAVKARGMATALVCNAGFTTTPHLLPMLAHYGLSPHLDLMVFSDELGFAKPDPRIFVRALEGVGFSADECAFVGDNPHTDIGGAQSVGLFAVQVGDKRRDGINPDVRIDDLSGLESALALFPP